MNNNGTIYGRRRGFTLAEILAALTIGAMVLIVVLAIYNRAQAGAASVIDKLERNRLPREVLQRIAEDLDRVISTGEETKITVDNKFQDGFAVSKIDITQTIENAKKQTQILERIIWQSSIDPDTGMLTLYRSHSGIALEDKLLDEQKEPWQRELFVPICTGLTFFRVEIPRSDAFLQKWTSESLPPAVTVTLSFDLPYKTVTGTFDVPEEDKSVQTIAVDRTRKLAFVIPPPPVNFVTDANVPASSEAAAEDIEKDKSVSGDEDTGPDEDLEPVEEDDPFNDPFFND